MNNRSQTTKVNDLVFPLLFAILGLWIYFLFPAECFKDVSKTNFIPPVVSEVLPTKSEEPIKTQKWTYSDRLEMVKPGPYTAGEEIEFLYNDEELPEK